MFQVINVLWKCEEFVFSISVKDFTSKVFHKSAPCMNIKMILRYVLEFGCFYAFLFAQNQNKSWHCNGAFDVAAVVELLLT